MVVVRGTRTMPDVSARHLSCNSNSMPRKAPGQESRACIDGVQTTPSRSRILSGSCRNRVESQAATCLCAILTRYDLYTSIRIAWSCYNSHPRTRQVAINRNLQFRGTLYLYNSMFTDHRDTTNEGYPYSVPLLSSAFYTTTGIPALSFDRAVSQLSMTCQRHPINRGRCRHQQP